MGAFQVEHWIDRWNRYWFPTTTTRTLALCRIIAVVAQLMWFAPHLERHINLVSKNPAFVDPQILIRGIVAVIPREMVFTPPGMTVLHWITVAAGVTALVGLFTRTSLFIFALGVWFFISHKYSYADIHHPEAIFAIFLMSLALAPSGNTLSIDALIRRYRGRLAGKSAELLEKSDIAMWPLKFAHVLLALTYFSTGATKLLAGGLGWMNGYTVQAYTFIGAMRRGRPWGIWLAQFHTLGILLGAMTLLFELFFFVSLLLPRTAPFFFFSGVLFHVGLYLFMGHPFFSHILLNAMLLVFLSPHWLPHLVSSYRLRFLGGKRAQAYEG